MQISAYKLSFLIVISRVLSQYQHTNVGLIPQIRSQSLPSKPFSAPYSLIICRLLTQ